MISETWVRANKRRLFWSHPCQSHTPARPVDQSSCCVGSGWLYLIRAANFSKDTDWPGRPGEAGVKCRATGLFYNFITSSCSSSLTSLFLLAQTRRGGKSCELHIVLLSDQVRIVHRYKIFHTIMEQRIMSENITTHNHQSLVSVFRNCRLFSPDLLPQVLWPALRYFTKK